jgi:hypothetical protein
MRQNAISVAGERYSLKTLTNSLNALVTLRQFGQTVPYADSESSFMGATQSNLGISYPQAGRDFRSWL